MLDQIVQHGKCLKGQRNAFVGCGLVLALQTLVDGSEPEGKEFVHGRFLQGWSGFR